MSIQFSNLQNSVPMNGLSNLQNNMPLNGNSVRFATPQNNVNWNDSNEVLRNSDSYSFVEPDGLFDSRVINKQTSVNTIDERATINEVEDTLGADVNVGIDPNTGERVFTVTDAQSGARVTTTMPVAPEPEPDAQCEFPSQTVVLERNINVFTSQPQVVSIDEDECGNTLGFVERIEKRLVADNWRPVSGESGSLVNLEANGNGVLRNSTRGLAFANNTGRGNNPPLNVGAARPRVNATRSRRNQYLGSLYHHKSA